MKDLLQLWPETLLFERKSLDDCSEEDYKNLIEKVFMPGLMDSRVSNVTAILCLLYEARNKNSQEYLYNVFLPWVYLKNKTIPYHQRILKEMSRHKEFDENSEEDILHAVNIYRNIVSELFDPLLTLLYASYKFIEGDDSNLFEIDLHAGERQKYEYVFSRINCKQLFSGYDPDVRNATSHTGGNGITINDGSIEFRSVKRGKPPKVKLIKWSNDQLFTHLLELMEFVNSIHICSDVFGIDSIDLISKDYKTLNQCIYYSLSLAQEKKIIDESEKKLMTIRSSKDLSEKEKLELLAKILCSECEKREIAQPNIGIGKQEGSIIIIIDNNRTLENDDQKLISSFAYLTRYGILARTVFGIMFDTFVVIEKFSGQYSITAVMSNLLLDKYIVKEAGLVDLLNDSTFYENEKRIELKVDFNNLKEVDSQHLGKPFPRLMR
ncbi:hypothetical protein PXQ17_000439 [Vibrio parahaemolyticus]|nr:hypothetical protein [Vibrio parahaemolyticus]